MRVHLPSEPGRVALRCQSDPVASAARCTRPNTRGEQRGATSAGARAIATDATAQTLTAAATATHRADTRQFSRRLQEQHAQTRQAAAIH